MQHFVKINGSYVSDRAITNISIPQGSVLGCYLFLLYINDLPKVSNRLDAFLFADDTALVHSHRDFDALVTNFNVELIKVNNWLTRNKLSLNVNKSVALLVSNRKSSTNTQRKLCINGCYIDYSREAKYLGVNIDDSLSFSNHIKDISSKISKNVGLLFRISHYVPNYVLD